jgi:hypothetical protein
MKIRIKSNTVRFRLSQNEVEQLIQQGEVWDTCQFGPNQLRYGLISNSVDRLTSSMEDHTIRIDVPSGLLKGWDVDERVGFDHRQPDGHYILIEKDWQCLKPRPHEDESNLFPNPQAKHV